MTKDSVYIYTLSNPTTNEIRYVGKTCKSLKTRLNGHLKDKRNNYRSCWIKSLLNDGLIPKIETIDVSDNDNWQLMERYWISQFKTWGFKLVNYTDGGESLSGYKHSKETRVKLSKSQTGKTYSDESKNKMSNSRIKYEKENKTEFSKRYDTLKETIKNKSEEQKIERKNKMSISMKLAHLNMNSETKKLRGNNISKSKGLRCALIDANGKILKEYNSCNMASKDIENICHESVVKSCKLNIPINNLMFKFI